MAFYKTASLSQTKYIYTLLAIVLTAQNKVEGARVRDMSCIVDILVEIIDNVVNLIWLLNWIHQFILATFV